MVHVDRTPRVLPAATETEPKAASGPVLIDPALFGHVSGGLPNTTWIEPAAGVLSDEPHNTTSLPNTNW